MKLTIFSALSVLGLTLIGSEAVNVVRIDANKKLVCLILPPAGTIIGDTQTIGHVQCTDGNPQLLPSNFFISQEFETTPEYVQAWGYMNPEVVGMSKKDGGGQYDIHLDSGDNKAEGYPVFVELLEPDTGRWCIRFCHSITKVCNMGNSSKGCEGALKITKWPSNVPSIAETGNSTSTKSGTAGSTTSAKSSSASASHVSVSGTSSVPTSSDTTPAAAGSSSSPQGKTSDTTKSSLGYLSPLAAAASVFYGLLL
ncbi:hypothetical protein BGZ76_009303 [Entomortierella beljakovae]|nr:hypothetical protein BGZ76_009303 [Entomortierella beljakovae]